MIFPCNRQSSKSFTKALNENTLMQRKKYRWHAQYSLDRADGIDQTNSPVTAELENLFLSIEDRRALYAALQRLSSLQRRRLLMRYADRLTYSEIARREGVAPRVAQRSIERALVKLNLMLKDAILVDSNV